MTTQTDAPKGHRLDELLESRRVLGGGLLWAAALLFMLAIWLGNKYPGLGILVWGPAGLLSLAALAGAIWLLLWRAWPAGASDRDAAEVAVKQRQVVAYALLAGSVLLLLLGLWLTFEHGLEAFPEVSGMVLMALIGLGTGFAQTRPPERKLDREALMAWLLARRHGVIIGLFVATGVCAALTLWALLTAGIGPESVGAALLALLFFGVGLWQALMLPHEANTQKMRLLVLFTGGGFGLIVALATLVRTYLWWRGGEIFAADTPMAESPNVWRLWLCAYVEIFALAVLFGSLLLGRTDIRQDAVMRRVLFGYNTALTGLVVLATLVLLNVVVYVTYPFTLQWTQSLGLHSLSESSKNLLKNLKDRVEVYVLLSPKQQEYDDTRTLLENAQAFTRMLHVRYISPDQQSQKYLELARDYPVLLRETEQVKGRLGPMAVGGEPGRGVLLVYGAEGGKRRPHAFIPSDDLLEQKQGGPRGGGSVVFRGEDAIMTQLDILAQNETKPEIYFTQSNGEMELVDALKDQRAVVGKQRVLVGRSTGAGLVLERLRRDGYEVHGLKWGARPAKDDKMPFPRDRVSGDLMVYSRETPEGKDEVPARAKLVVVAYPEVPFSREAREALERYLQKGGKLLLLTNFMPLRDGGTLDPGLGDLLRKYNVRLGDNFLLATGHPNPFRIDATPPEDTRNRVAESFRTVVFTLGEGARGLGLVRTVEEISPNGEGVVEPLLVATKQLNKEVWAETNPEGYRDPLGYLDSLRAAGVLEAKGSAKPLPVAVAVSDRTTKKPVMAVFGDTRFASNRYVEADAPYYDFLVSTIQWLAERPSRIGILPRVTTTYEIQPERVNKPRLLWLPLGLVLLFFVGLGLGIWVARRR
jgi:hypothetical protein